MYTVNTSLSYVLVKYGSILPISIKIIHCPLQYFFMCWGMIYEWVVLFLLLGLCSSLSRKLYFSQIMVVIGTNICETMDYDKFYSSC